MTEREIFFEALEMPTPEARAAYLQAACSQDVALRRKVEELLREHFSSDSLLAGPALDELRAVSVESPVPESAAQTLGRYKLLEKIGEGGFGEVWMAEQREPVKRRVALKIIKPGMDSRQIVARFEAERQALAMMDHANIAKIFDAGTTDTGRPYFVMELVRGMKITEYCDQQQLPTLERLRLFILVCQAIQHAHQKGIIHRDIKPSNILVTLHDGVPVPKVIDFGIAKATQQELTDKTVFTQFQQFMGTPAYISPEQAEMSGLDIDTRADIYSLGVLLYELLVGQTPFDAKEMMQGGLDALRQIIREKEPLRPSTRLNTLVGEARTTVGKRRQTEVGRLMHQLQGDLDWIVMKCLEKDRTRRYETANGLAADIQRHLKCEPVVARPPSKLYEFQKTVKRHTIGFAAAGAVILALATGLGVATWTLIKEKRARERADNAEQEQKRLREEAQQARTLAEIGEKKAERSALLERDLRTQTEQLVEQNRYSLYAARIKVAEGQFREGNAGEAQRILDSLRPIAGQTDLRSFDWYHLQQLLHSETLSLSHKGHVLCVAYSPDGSLLATSGDDPIIHLWDTASGRERGQLVGHQWRTAALSFTPDGKRLASGGADKTLRLWDLDRTNDFQIIHTGTNEITKLVFSRNGRFLAWGEGAIPVGVGAGASAYSPRGSPGRVRVWDLAENRLVGSFIAQDHSVRCLAISPDTRKLLSGGEDQIAKLHDPVTGILLAVQTNLSGTIFAGGFSEDGKDAIVATWWPYQNAGEIVVLDGNSLARKRVLVADAGQILCLAISPDGKKLAGGGADMIVRVWDMTTGAELQTIRGHTEEVAAVTFAPNSKDLATGGWDASVKTWNTERQPARQEFSTKDNLSIAYSPDGKLLVCAGESVEVRDTASGNLLRVLREYRGDQIRVAFSPDGSVLAATDQRGAVHFWNTASWDHWIGKDGDTQREFQQGILVDSHLAFFPDSQTLVVPGNDRIIRFWDVKTGALKETITGNSAWIASVDVTRDGEMLVSGDRDKVCFWDLKTKRIKSSLPENGVVLRLSPDGKQMLSGRYNLLLRDLPDLTVRHRIQGHKSIVYSLAFSPDNRLVATAGWDGAVKIWHRLSGQELLTIPSRGGVAWSVKFAPDNHALAFSCGVGKGGKVVIVRAAADEPITANKSPAFPDVVELSIQCDRFGLSGNWKEAISLLKTLVKLEPANHWNYHRLSPLFIAVGNTESYHQTVQRMKDLFVNEKDPVVAERMAIACLALPSPTADFGPIDRWVELALTATPGGAASSWNQDVKALAEYRQGNFTAAALWAEKAIVNEGVSAETKAQSWMILAMARWHLKQLDTAREALASGTLVFEKDLPTLELGYIGSLWNHWIIAQALHREACLLIDGKAPPDPFKRDQ